MVVFILCSMIILSIAFYPALIGFVLVQLMIIHKEITGLSLKG